MKKKTLAKVAASTNGQAAAAAPQATLKRKATNAAAAEPAAAEATQAATEVPKAARKRRTTKAAAAQAATAEPGSKGDGKPAYYLVKSEPHEFSIQALQERPNQTEGWEGE